MRRRCLTSQESRIIAAELGISINTAKRRFGRSHQGRLRGWRRKHIKWIAAVEDAAHRTAFATTLMRTMAAAVGMPWNLAAADSGYSYESGRLDHETFYERVG